MPCPSGSETLRTFLQYVRLRWRPSPGDGGPLSIFFTRSIELAGPGLRRRFPGSGLLFHFAVAGLVMPSLIVGLLHNGRIPGIGLEGDRVPTATLLLGARSATTRREATCSGRPVNLACAALPATQSGPPAERKLDAQRHGISRCRSRRTPASRRTGRYRRTAPRYASHTRGLQRGIDPRHPIIAGIARSVLLAHPSTYLPSEAYTGWGASGCRSRVRSSKLAQDVV
jgi:hypothetical protein